MLFHEFYEKKECIKNNMTKLGEQF